MADVIDIPLARECHCGAKLRPATHAEIQADLLDPRYKDVAEHAAQGRHDWNHRIIGQIGKNVTRQIILGFYAVTPAVVGMFG